MKRRLLLTASAALLVTCAGTPDWQQEAPASQTLYAWIAWDSRAQPLYRIAVSIAWSELRARAQENRARVVLSATIAAPDGQPLDGHAWTDVVDVAAGSGLFYERTRELGTQPGKQELVLHLLVDGTALGNAWRRRFDVREADGGLRLGEPLLLRLEGGASWVEQGRAYVEEGESPLRVRSFLYDFAPTLQTAAFAVTYALRDDAGAIVFQGSRRVDAQGAVTPFDLEMPMPAFGVYRLELEASRGTRLATTARRFEVGIADLSTLVGVAGSADLLRLILTPAELDSLHQVPAEQRGVLWREFWRRRDPDPATPENEFDAVIQERLRYVGTHFSTSIPGWRSDRGRVYIRMGAPLRVEAVGQPQALERMERWTYEEGVFLFVDRDRSGEYALLRTNVPGF
ncbi:MAG: GWxTD domain-containing protein [Candidatus Latescibacterota bacterium]|nr:MAG: GWxTD domain-containing protein [Candidatus Latescibacterota bacterium]